MSQVLPLEMASVLIVVSNCGPMVRLSVPFTAPSYRFTSTDGTRDRPIVNSILESFSNLKDGAKSGSLKLVYSFGGTSAVTEACPPPFPPANEQELISCDVESSIDVHALQTLTNT